MNLPGTRSPCRNFAPWGGPVSRHSPKMLDHLRPNGYRASPGIPGRQGRGCWFLGERGN